MGQFPRVPFLKTSFHRLLYQITLAGKDSLFISCKPLVCLRTKTSVGVRLAGFQLRAFCVKEEVQRSFNIKTRTRWGNNASLKDPHHTSRPLSLWLVVHSETHKTAFTIIHIYKYIYTHTHSLGRIQSRENQINYCNRGSLFCASYHTGELLSKFLFAD